MAILDLFWQSALLVAILMLALWLLSLLRRDSSIVDPFWGTGFVILACFYFLRTPQGDPIRKALLLSLVTIWGLRLSLHLLRRNLSSGEDQRYARWRQEAGPSWWWLSLFKVFLLQGFLMWLISLPLVAAQWTPTPPALTGLEIFASAFWLLGFFFEALGDWQLTRFKANPANRGKVLDSGLWRYTRHPNYFGEVCIWWAYGLFAWAVGAWWALFSPLLMTGLLLRISGLSMLERDLKQKKPAYADYIRRTSAFLPLSPKHLK